VSISARDSRFPANPERDVRFSENRAGNGRVAVQGECQPHHMRPESSAHNDVSRNLRKAVARMVKPRSRAQTTEGKSLLSRFRHTGRRLLAVAAVPAIVAGAFLAASAPAQAAVRSDASSDYGLVNYEHPSGGNFCLGVGGDINDSPSVLWGCNAHADQRWQFESVYPNKTYGGYTFMNLVNNNGSCLAVAGASYTEGTDLYGWTCKGSPDQFWAVYSDCDGYAALLNYNAYEHGDTYVAGVAGGVIKDGTSIVLYQYQNECNNQFWNFIVND
jgi:hypothetical protein